MHCLDKGKTISAQTYIEDWLKPVVGAIEKQLLTSGTKNMKILNDNAKPHVAKIVRKYLNNKGIGIIDHPLYWPDLAPCDFWLFSQDKQHLTDTEDVQSLKKQITDIVAAIPKKE